MADATQLNQAIDKLDVEVQAAIAALKTPAAAADITQAELDALRDRVYVLEAALAQAVTPPPAGAELPPPLAPA